MQKLTKETRSLLYPYEVLRARLDIREFFLKTIVRQVYENSGQVLTLVRMQLDAQNLLNPEDVLTTDHPGRLVEETIRELRVMCRSLYPDQELLMEKGFVGFLQVAVNSISGNDGLVIASTEDIYINESAQLITLKIILDVLTSIHEKNGRLTAVALKDANQHFHFAISYLCKESAFPTENFEQEDQYLSLKQRVNLIGGKLIELSAKENNYQIILQILKHKPAYE